MAAAKIRREMVALSILPIASAEERGPFGELSVHTYQNDSYPLRKGSALWATGKPAPHFGKPSGLAPGSGQQSKIM